jgi:hypothetical protein
MATRTAHYRFPAHTSTTSGCSERRDGQPAWPLVPRPALATPTSQPTMSRPLNPDFDAQSESASTSGFDPPGTSGRTIASTARRSRVRPGRRQSCELTRVTRIDGGGRTPVSRTGTHGTSVPSWLDQTRPALGSRTVATLERPQHRESLSGVERLEYRHGLLAAGCWRWFAFLIVLIYPPAAPSWCRCSRWSGSFTT